MHKNRLLLSQKGLYTHAMVGMLHMAGSCGSKEPKLTNPEVSKDTATEETLQLQKDTPLTAEISQVQLETVTKPISEKIPKERQKQETTQEQQQTPKEEEQQQTPPPKEIATEAISKAGKSINQLQADLNKLNTAVGDMKTAKNELKTNISVLQNNINTIEKSVINTIISTDASKIKNSKNFAEIVELKLAESTDLKEKKLGMMICQAIYEWKEPINSNENECYNVRDKVVKQVQQKVNKEINYFDRIANTSLNNLVTVLGDATTNDNALGEIGNAITAINAASVPVTTANKQTILDELDAAKVALGKITLDTAKANVNELKIAVKGTILETISINNQILQLEDAISSVDQNTIDKVKKAVNDAIAAVNNLP